MSHIEIIRRSSEVYYERGVPLYFKHLGGIIRRIKHRTNEEDGFMCADIKDKWELSYAEACFAKCSNLKKHKKEK